jgi:hypothetical protein
MDELFKHGYQGGPNGAGLGERIGSSGALPTALNSVERD